MQNVLYTITYTHASLTLLDINLLLLLISFTLHVYLGSFSPDNKPGSGDLTPKSHDPHVHEVKILKEMGKGLGINIASRSSPGGSSRVVIDSIEKDGPTYMDGRLKKG